LQQIWENTENPEIGYRYARHLLEICNLEKAQELVSFFIETASNTDSLSQLAEEFFKQDDFESASILLRKAVEVDPQFERGWRFLARSYDGLGENKKALEAIERAIAINPTKPENWTTKSGILLKTEEYESFFRSSDTAIDLINNLGKKDETGDLMLLRIFRIVTQIKLNNSDKVLLESKLAQEEYPDFEIFYIFPVDYLLNNKQPKEALDILRSAPTHKLRNKLRPHKYKVLHQMGRSKEAWKGIQPYLRKTNEKDFEHLINIGTRFYLQGLTDPALSVHYQLMDFHPENPRVANNLGYILIGEGDYSSALEVLRVVANESISTLFRELARCNIAYINNLEGDFSSALLEIEKVLNSEFTQEEATLRVTFWINGSMIADPSPIPGRHLTVEECALSCAVSSGLAIGNVEMRDNFANKLMAVSKNQTLKSMVLGSLELAKSNTELAKFHWENALNSAKLETDQKALDAWLKLAI